MMLAHPPKFLPWLYGLLFAMFACAVTCGCMTDPVNFYAPGPIDVQQRRAVRFDPYPSDHVGPELLGTRPRDYQIDRSAASRAALLREAWWGFPL